jgi:glycosyltransferase involved in cell wall biosynthesis
VEPQSPEQLAQAILPLVTDRDRAEQLGQAGRLRARKLFRLESCVTQFLKLYAEVIQQYPKLTAQGTVP